MKKIILLLSSIVAFGSDASVALDYAKLENYFKILNSCSNNDFLACVKITDFVKIENEDEAKKYIKSQCDNSNMSACYLTYMLSNDYYTKYNALRLACQNKFELACTDLVVNFEKNSTNALKILEQQCNNENNLNSCHMSAIYYKSFLDKNNALKYSQKACAKGFYNSCLIQADLHSQMGDIKKSYKLLEEVCYHNYEPACFEAAEINYQNGNFKISKKFLELSCNLGNKFSCQKVNGF